MKTNIGSSIDIMLCERDLVRIIVKNQKNKKKTVRLEKSLLQTTQPAGSV